MTDEKLIEEMAKDIFESKVAIDGSDMSFGLIDEDDHFHRIARFLYKHNYRKLPEDAVVLTKGAYESLSNKARANVVNAVELRKETAREVLDKVYDWGQGFFIEHSFMEEDEFNGILDEVNKLFLNVVEVEKK